MNSRKDELHFLPSDLAFCLFAASWPEKNTTPPKESARRVSFWVNFGSSLPVANAVSFADSQMSGGWLPILVGKTHRIIWVSPIKASVHSFWCLRPSGIPTRIISRAFTLNPDDRGYELDRSTKIQRRR